MLKERNIAVDRNGTTSFTSSSDVTDVTGFYQPEVRIYFLNMYSIHARRLICNVSTIVHHIILGWGGEGRGMSHAHNMVALTLLTPCLYPNTLFFIYTGCFECKQRLKILCLRLCVDYSWMVSWSMVDWRCFSRCNTRMLWHLTWTINEPNNKYTTG